MLDLEAVRVKVRAARTLPPPAICRALREEAGLTQDDVAGVVGCSRQAVAAYEAGRRHPSGDRRVRYSELLLALREELAA